MENDRFQLQISPRQMKNEKNIREKNLKNVVIIICGLLNCRGGTLILRLDNDSNSNLETDGAVRMIEQRLLDVFGSCLVNSNIYIARKEDACSLDSFVYSKIEFIVEPSQSLCSVEYNLFIPTQTQLIPISSWEHPRRIQEVLNRELACQIVDKIGNISFYEEDTNRKKCIMDQDFVLNKPFSFPDSFSIQLKQLKPGKSTDVSLADQITGKNSKLNRYISAFSNYNGGKVLYGVAEDSTVTGVFLTEKDKEEIVRKVTKLVDNLVWSEGQLERDKHWNIELVPVKHEFEKLSPTLFVIVISINSMPGGVFVKLPESYHIVQGKVERMPFLDWKKRFHLEGELAVRSPAIMVGRISWSTTKEQKIWCNVLQQLLKYQNDGDFSNFKNFGELVINTYTDNNEVALLVLVESGVFKYKTGEITEAERMVADFENLVERSSSANHDLLRLRAIYAKSAVARAKGNHKNSLEIAVDGLQLAEIVPAGVVTAWFYDHVANVEKFLAEQPGYPKQSLMMSAEKHFACALQHCRASEIEQEFIDIVADTQQRTYIFRAIKYLGDYANGANVREVSQHNVQEAESDLMKYHNLVIESPVSRYRNIYYLLTLSDLRLCQWWRRDKELLNVEEPLDDVLNLKLKRLSSEALEYSREANELSTRLNFTELKHCAQNRITKMKALFENKQGFNNR